jgi:hypothetical protein
MIGFSDQVDLSGIGDCAGVLRMTVVDPDGERRTICESASGLLLVGYSWKHNLSCTVLTSAQHKTQP